MRVALYAFLSNGRANHIAQAMSVGLAAHGIHAAIETRWNGKVVADVAIAYGWNHEPVFTAYRRAGGHFAYFDMGYFNRKPAGDKGGAREGHHRLSVDGWDTADTMARGMPSDRWDDLGIEVALNRTGEQPGAVLVAGMSGKAAGTHGFKPLEWELRTVAQIKNEFPTVEVIYRPKPASLDAIEPIADVLKRVGMIVTHHSNVAVDGLVAAVPSWAAKGVGKMVSVPAMLDAVARRAPVLSLDERRALLADVAYAQWAPSEMRSGAAWEHILRIIE